MKTKQVRVLRAFYFNSAPTKVGDIVEYSQPFAQELIAANKAEAYEKPADKSEGSITNPDNGDKTTTHATRGRGAKDAV